MVRFLLYNRSPTLCKREAYPGFREGSSPYDSNAKQERRLSRRLSFTKVVVGRMRGWFATIALRIIER